VVDIALRRQLNRSYLPYRLRPVLIVYGAVQHVRVLKVMYHFHNLVALSSRGEGGGGPPWRSSKLPTRVSPRSLGHRFEPGDPEKKNLPRVFVARCRTAPQVVGYLVSFLSPFFAYNFSCFESKVI
jgi:hypothetical protein